MATTAASMSTSWTSSSSLSPWPRHSADRNLVGMLSIAGPKASVNGLIIGGGRVSRNRGRLQIGVALASYGGGGRSEYSSQSYNSEPRSGYGGGGGGRSSDANKMFVGNLPWSANDMRLEELFGEYGSVTEARVVKDRETGRLRGFGFVSMSSTEEMNAAIQALDGYDLDGRPIRVNQAESRF